MTTDPQGIDTSKGASAVAEIQRDLACPSCQYNLRGLRGEIIDCPECGANIDIAKLIARKWTLQWWQAPGFNLVAAPVAVALIGGVVCLIGFGVEVGGLRQVPWISLALFLAAVAIWGWLMTYIRRFWGDSWGVTLALIAHAVLLCYDAGMAGIAVGIVFLLAPVKLGFIISIIAWAVAVALLWAGRRMERFIGQECIRRHLTRG